MRILFCLKKRDTYWGKEDTYSTLSSGLLNSATFVSDYLSNFQGVRTKLVQVIDNNEIDREVAAYKPDIVIIEAFWVVPEKFEMLTKLHPKVKWIVRNHSEIPFMAQEGITIDWSIRYLSYKNVFISGNSRRVYSDMIKFVAPVIGKEVNDRVVFLPNIYPPICNSQYKTGKKEDGVLNIGCFGALRPLKNNLIQAIAAINYAHENRKKLKFHINGGRTEGAGSTEILKNIRHLFKHNKHELVEHEWYPHNKFLQVMSEMDCSMQVSFSESFNIVSADAVSVGVPIVVSKEVLWAPWFTKASPVNSNSISRVLGVSLTIGSTKAAKWLTEKSLSDYSIESAMYWLDLEDL